MRYAHTNLIAHDAELLIAFYRDVFGCEPVPPARHQRGEWLARGTGVANAALRGMHLRLPGGGDTGPTLEIFTYGSVLERPESRANRVGLGHLAFEVDDVEATFRQVLGHGGRPHGEIVEHDVVDVGRLTFTYVEDPEGNLIELQRWDRVDSPPSVEVFEGYERWAATYDSDVNPTRELDRLLFPDLVGELRDRDVLELGCGTGKNTGALLAARTVAALDFSEAMLSRARAKVDASHVRFLRHDLREPLPFDSESFDLVTFDLVLEHLGALDAPFSEAARVLRPGGRLVVVELHPSRQRLGRQARFATGDTTVHIEAHFHSLADYVAAMTRAGVLLTELGEWTLHDGRALPATERRLVPRVLSLVARRE